MTEDELDIELRSVAEVAHRTIILSAVIRRLWIETLTTDSADELAGQVFDLRAWLHGEGLWSDLTPVETMCLERPPGELTEDDVAGLAWQGEGLAALGWSLGLIDRLGATYPADVASAVRAVPEPWGPSAPWVQARTLRPEAEIARERDRAEIYAWRIGIEEPLRAAVGVELAEYATAIEAVSREASAAELLPPGESEFTIAGRPITSYSEAELGEVSALAAERLRALNWLCGFGDSWDDVPLDV